MATYKTTALVLGRTNLGEADRIITLMTEDYGKLRVVAKGVKKIKSRMAGHVEPFSRVELMLAEGKNLDIITSARLVSYPHSIIDDMPKLSRAFMITSMLDRLTEERLSQPELFHLAQEAFEGLEAGIDPVVVELFFKLRLLEPLGYQPELAHCVTCHQQGSDFEYRLSAERGGIVDTGCSTGLDPVIDQRTIKLWRLVYTHNLKGIAAIDGVAALAASSLEACDTFYEYHFGRRFRPNLEPVL